MSTTRWKPTQSSSNLALLDSLINKTSPYNRYKWFLSATALILGLLLLSALAPSASLLHNRGLTLRGGRNILLNRSHNANVTVKALVFWGPDRKATQRILNCYLERNLRRNGGLLSEVAFLLTTEVASESLQLLNELIRQHPEYRKHVLPHPEKGRSRYASYYANLEADTFYLKVDDDIVWIDDAAIPSLLAAKLSSQFLILSANVLNHCDLSWVHGHLGAVLPFGPANGEGKPWRLLSNVSTSLEGSDAWGMQYHPFGHSWKSGQCAAVQHYSFLHRERERSLSAFKRFDTWIFDSSGYERWSISMIFFQGKDLAGEDMPGEDEVAISRDIPKARHLQTAAVGKALIAHYAYGTQREYLNREHPNLLQEYAAVAEQYCVLAH